MSKKESSIREIDCLLDLKEAIFSFKSGKQEKGMNVLVGCDKLETAINGRLQIAYSNFGKSMFKRVGEKNAE